MNCLSYPTAEHSEEAFKTQRPVVLMITALQSKTLTKTFKGVSEEKL